MDAIIIALLVVACWLGCGAHEIITDHLWWERNFRETHGWEPLPIKWWDRHAKEMWLTGPIGLCIGYAYRGLDRKVWKDG